MILMRASGSPSALQSIRKVSPSIAPTCSSGSDHLHVSKIPNPIVSLTLSVSQLCANQLRPSLTDNDDLDVDGQVFPALVRRYASIESRVAVINRSEDEQSLVIVRVPFAKTERKYAAKPESNPSDLSNGAVGQRAANGYSTYSNTTTQLPRRRFAVNLLAASVPPFDLFRIFLSRVGVDAGEGKLRPVLYHHFGTRVAVERRRNDQLGLFGSSGSQCR